MNAQTRPHGRCNVVRFMPDRKPRIIGNKTDDRIMLNGTRYSRTAMETPLGFQAGVAMGPGDHRPVDEDGKPGFSLSSGGVIIPAMPNAKLETVPVRNYTFEHPNGKKETRQFVDWATFQKSGKEMFQVVACEEDKTMYFEVWTGHTLASEGTFQLLQANHFQHGSVAFAGSSALLINAASTTKARKGKLVDEASVPGVREHGAAELMSEHHGGIVGGIPLWSVRLWRVQYSSQDSEAVLVRQLNRFYLLQVENDKHVFKEVPADKFEKRYERFAMAAAEAAAKAA